MAYTNFAAAWTAWGNRYSTWLSDLTYFNARWTAISGSTTWTDLRTKVSQAFGGLSSLLGYIPILDPADPLNIPVPSCIWYANLNPAGGAVTMAAILSAMLGAKFTELQDFIGIEDAYRVALWNAPFNADFYAALARGFQKWP